MTKIIWFVNHGIDGSHLWDTNIFDTRKSAEEFISTLPVSYLGERAYELVRADYTNCKIYGNTVDFRTVKSRA